MATSTKARKPKAKEAAPPVSNVPVFAKRNILTFRRYANRRDLLSVLLKDGEEYTIREGGACFRNRNKADICTGQNLVLRQKSAAAKGHINSPYLS